MPSKQPPPASDQLLRYFEFPLAEEFWPYGFPLRLETNSPLVLEAARRSWGLFEGRRGGRAAVLRVGVTGPESGPVPEPPLFRSQEHLVSIMAPPDNIGVCDLRAGFAYAFVTPAVAGDPDYFRYFFLDALGYSLVTADNLAPVHAACVSRNGAGVLLSGPSGAGKSTLAYACARRGWTYTCDDASNVLIAGRPTAVTGACHQVRLRQGATAFFPELVDRVPRRLPTGKIGFEIRTSELPAIRTAPEAEARHLVVLDRRPEAGTALTPLRPADLLPELLSVLNYGDRRMHKAWRRCYRRLAASAKLWRMAYWDLDEATARLERLADQGD